MKIRKIFVALGFFLASFSADLVGIFFSTVGSNYSIPYQVRDILKIFSGVPVAALVFGLLFGAMARFSSKHHKEVGGEEIFGFTLISMLIFIIMQYGGALINPAFSNFGISPILFWNIVAAFFFALVAWKGLFINLGGLGVFLTTILGATIAGAKMFGLDLPFEIQKYWFTAIGTFMGIFGAFGKE